MPRKKNGGPSAGAKAARLRYTKAQHKAKEGKNLVPTHGFTMRDEARNTSQHQSNWSGDKLRERPVAFVSAGLIEPLKDPRAEDEEDDDAKVEQGFSDLEGRGKAPAISEPVTVEASAASTPDPAKPTEDLHLDELHGPATEDSPDFDSPDFFFDLRGDPDLAKPSLPSASIPNIGSPAEESESDSSEVIVFKGRSALSQNKATKQTNQARITLDEINVEIKAVETSVSIKPEAEPPLAQPAILLDEPGPAIGSLGTRSEDDDDAIIADYIANMAEDSDDDPLQSLIFKHRDLGGDDDAFGDEQNYSDQFSHGGDSDDEEDEDAEEEFAEEYPEPTEEIEADQMVDDATLARLLSKQEELGMGSDELLISDMLLDVDGTGDFAGRSRQSSKGSKRQKRSGDRIPSASAVADAFDDLDLMDWNRPSLQNFTRGRRKKPVFDVGDPDIESALRTAWDKNRERKKQRKLERENLRTKGLLGKHANPDDPRVKYPSGMTLEDIKGELRAFLLSTDQTLQLPPMDKSARKILHDLANKFNIKSHSTGSGDQRRPTLCRTKRTFTYVEEHFELAVSRVGRKYFHRPDLKNTTSQRKAGGRSGHSAVTYREGEVVGASAPELGQDNKGRAMLEKMGWSRGMALGAMDNKGILQPVAHVVKRSKAGLGQS